LVYAMAEPRPIACTLTASELKDRGAAWGKLFASGLLRRERVPGGIRLIAEPGAAVALVELVDLERECCEWIDFEVDGPAVTMTADGAGEDVLAGMFTAG
jgi:hypothetical protein